MDGDDDPVRRYLGEIGRFELLTKDDEVRLGKLVEAGAVACRELGSGLPLSATRRRQLRRAVRSGDDAAEQFVQANLRLVVSIARRYERPGAPLLDLIQDGNLGLMHAVEKFDWRKGFKFSTYATWWIRQAVTRGIASSGRTIRIPIHASDTMARIRRVRVQMELELGRTPTVDEVASAAEVPAGKVVDALQHAVDPLSLSEPLGEGSDVTWADLVVDPRTPDPGDAVAEAQIPEVLAAAMALLDERERAVLRMRFGFESGRRCTLEEIGAELGVTRERIRQIEVHALAKLRHPSNDCGARELLVG